MATALLEKQDVERPEAADGETAPVPYHWTVAALYRALDAGVFEHPERLELVQGRIVENMSQDPLHRSARVRLGNRFRAAFAGKLIVIDECPVHIAYDGELTPDLVALRGAEADFDARHPEGKDIAVLVEVSNTTAAYDLGEKALLYAQAGVTDYWVVLVNEATIVRHRVPTPEGYQEVTRLSGADPLSLLELPEVVWTIDALFGHGDSL